MELSPDKKMIFSDDSDYVFLRWVSYFTVSPEKLELIATIREALYEQTEDRVFLESISKEELQKIISDQEISHLISLGQKVPASDVLRAISSNHSGIKYEIGAKWIPVVLAEAIVEMSWEDDRRDELLELMVDGLKGLKLAEAIEDGWEDLEAVLDLHTQDAQRSFNKSRRAGEIATTIVREFNLDS